MENSSAVVAVARKYLLALGCFFLGFSGITKGEAQDIVGKWQGVSVKNYYSTEYAKEVGKSMEEKSAKEIGSSEIDYLADHSFVVIFSAPNSSEEIRMKGTWSSTGDQLKFTFEPQYNPKNKTTTATYSIKGNTMETTVIISPPSRIIKTISTATRL